MNDAAFPCDVFLSHSAKDKAVVRVSSLSASNGERAGVRCRSPRPAQRLQNDGLKVWFDEWVLKPEVPLAHRRGEGSGVRAAKIGERLPCFALQPSALSLQPLLRAPLNQERRFIPRRLDDAPSPGRLRVENAHCSPAGLEP